MKVISQTFFRCSLTLFVVLFLAFYAPLVNAGFGITPPYVRNTSLTRNSTYEQQILLDDTDKFYPASLIKLPIAVTYYKIAELEPSVFERQLQIPVDAGDNSDQYYPPAEPMVPGRSYSIKEMIQRMLIYSDNAPFTPLADGAGVLRDKVLSDLGIHESSASESGGAWNVNARTYAAIFRSLYNASYLNVEYSNELLEILSKTSFSKGLVAGVPDNVRVAHKFGEAVGTDKDGRELTRILNDCGIIYKPQDPFILCVMTEGEDYSQMERVIQDITRAAYEAIK